MRREVRRHEGAEIKTEGDSFYVVFESPAAAIDCAVAILRAAAERARANPDQPLLIGMGLHAGETVPFDDQFVGSAVNVGARLASKAGPGELLVSDTFRGLVRTGVAHPMTDRGALRLKGVAERIRAWRVEWGEGDAPAAAPARPAMARTPPSADVPLPTAAPPLPPRQGDLLCPVLVGRERESAQLDEAIADATDGRGALILVSGEAGVGKSALLRELQRRAAARSFVLLPGAALESDPGLPYAPFISAIRSGYREGRSDALRTALGRLAPDLAPLFPEVEQRDRERSTASTVERHRIPVAFATFFARLCSASPVALVLEDLHWADEASLALLERLGHELAPWRVVVAATYRSDELHRLHPLMRTVASLRRDRIPREIALSPLGPEESAALIAAAAGDDPRFTPELTQAIYGRAQGNPFFTEELLRAVVDPHGRAGVTIPASVRDAVRLRLQHLGPSARATVAAASVFGERCSFELLRLVRSLDESALAADLREAVDEKVLVETPDSVEAGYVFRHALTREVVYEQMLLPERRRLHLLAAAALASDDRTEPASLAEQWRLGGDRERAAEAYVRAARSALALYAPTEAVGHVERAIEMRGIASPEDYELMARAYLFFDPVKAREAADRGLELMPRSEPVLRRIRLMRIGGRARYLLGDAPGNAELAREAWALAEGDGDLAAQAEAADWIGVADLTRGNAEDARRWAERAAEAARASGELAVEGSATVTLASAISDARPAEALRLLDGAAALARRTASSEVMARVHNNVVVYSFAVEAERPRLVRIERALEFVRRYGLARTALESFLFDHETLALTWPEHELPMSAETPDDIYAEWYDIDRAVMAACRRGPTADLVDRMRRIAARGKATGEPQWAIPLAARYALFCEWAGDPGAGAAYAELLALAGAYRDPDLALVALPFALDLPAMLAFMRDDPGTLERIAKRLPEVEGHAGEADMVEAFRRASSGDDALPTFERAAAELRRRGLRLGAAIDLWALARRGAVGAAWSPVVAPTLAELRGAGAEWLATDIERHAG